MTTPTAAPLTIPRWHPQSPFGCRSCGRTKYPHYARGLCNPCYLEIQADERLDDYPTVSAANGWELSPIHATIYLNHKSLLAQAWARQRHIAGCVGPFLDAHNCEALDVIQPPPRLPRLGTPEVAKAA